jgi:4-hydroxy-tetrahydrodipicolinate reductase
MSVTASPRIGIAGALGRMGRAVALLAGDAVTARFDRPGSTGNGLVSQVEALGLCDVIIDFTSGEASAALATAAAAHGGPALVIGSTGLSDDHRATIAAAAERVPVVLSGNFSLGVNILTGLVRQAAERLAAADYDIEVFEAHHRRKLDAPSGTALMLGEAAAAGRGATLSELRSPVREGITGPRRTGEIGFSVLRAGDLIGEHSVVFASDEEVLTLSHSARDRSLFARGALAAARWAAGRAPGLYGMGDVLGL